jgi:glycosyltransferase involved in cell wall biosynthesis
VSRPRLLGAALEPLHDYREARTRTSRLFIELERLFPLAGFVRPVLRGPTDWWVKLRAFHPDRDSWRGRAWLSPLAFRLRSELAGRQLARRDGLYDVIFQMQTLFAPGRHLIRPYVIYTDNTYTLTREHYPAWAPLGSRAARQWTELERVTFQHASAVFGTSEWVCEAIRNDYGCDPARVVAVGAGSNSLADIERKAYARRIALFVGNKYELKGVPTLLEAWSIVGRELPDALLWIVGLEPRGRVDHLPTVQWFGWLDDRKRLDELFAEASLLVLPSRFEAFSNALLEGMGNGLPCVATAVGGTPEIVDEGTTGLLVPPGEPEPLAAALIQLLSDPDKAERFGRAGRQKVLEDLNWGAVARRMAPHIEAAVRR